MRQAKLAAGMADGREKLKTSASLIIQMREASRISQPETPTPIIEDTKPVARIEVTVVTAFSGRSWREIDDGLTRTGSRSRVGLTSLGHVDQ